MQANNNQKRAQMCVCVLHANESAPTPGDHMNE